MVRLSLSAWLAGIAGNCNADKHARSRISVSLAEERKRVGAPLASFA